MRENSILVQVMSVIEDFTPIKPVARNRETFPAGNAMSVGGVFGLSEDQVYALLVLGLGYATYKIVTGS